MFIILIPYRARGKQIFRRNELMAMIENTKKYFAKNNIEFKIVICEQNDDNYFNRGMLLNVAFLESERLFGSSNKYFHMNTDYTFNLDRNFPDELLNLKSGFIDLHRPPFPVLGAACVFDSESYKKINGFPNDLCGWGGDDWAIYNRIIIQNVPLETPNNLFNSGFIMEAIETGFSPDQLNNRKNMELASRNDIDTNGLTTCIYKNDQFGEFNDNAIIFHYLISF